MDDLRNDYCQRREANVGDGTLMRCGIFSGWVDGGGVG